MIHTAIDNKYMETTTKTPRTAKIYDKRETFLKTLAENNQKDYWANYPESAKFELRLDRATSMHNHLKNRGREQEIAQQRKAMRQALENLPKIFPMTSGTIQITSK